MARTDEKVLLVEKQGTLFVVLRSSGWLFPFGAGVSYHEFPLEKARRLRGFINDAEAIALRVPASTHDLTPGYVRMAAMLGVLGLILLVLTHSLAVAAAIVVALLTTCAKLYRDASRSVFVDRERINLWTKALLVTVGLAGLVKLAALALFQSQ